MRGTNLVVEADSTEDGQTAQNTMIKECVVQAILAPMTQPSEHLEGGQGKGRGHEISPFVQKSSTQSLPQRQECHGDRQQRGLPPAGL